MRRAFWNSYVQYYLDHFSSVVFTTDGGLASLRDKLFISVLLLTFPICLLAYIPSFIISLQTDQFIIALSDTIAMLSLVYIFFNKKVRIRNKKILFSVTFYILSFILFVYMGIKGPSITIFICISVLITLYQSKRAGLIAVSLNAFLFLFILAADPINSISLTFFQIYTPVEWLAVGLNLIAFNALMVLSVASIVNQLNESFLKEKDLRATLKSDSLDLMVAKRKAEESDQLKTAFLNNISHEIRTPLNAITGFSALLTMPDNSLEAQIMYIESIQKGSDHLLSIFSDIIDVASLEAKAASTQLTRVNLNTRIENLRKHYLTEAKVKNISLVSKTGLPYEKAEILTDRSKLDRILSNLISNAIKFTTKGQIIFGYELKDSLIEFYFSDTGIGVPTELQSKIFESFFQAEKSLTREFEGTGLGLSICKAFIEQMGGEIWLQSEPGKGSTFYFTLPYVQPVPEMKAGIQDPDSDIISLHKQITALVAEDDEINFKLIKSNLTALNIKVIRAVNGMEAVELCRLHKNIGLVLMDVKMPGMDGYTASKKIRELRPDVIIIAQTAYFDDKETALKNSCDDFIRKPFSREQFILKVKENLDRV